MLGPINNNQLSPDPIISGFTKQTSEESTSSDDELDFGESLNKKSEANEHNMSASRQDNNALQTDNIASRLETQGQHNIEISQSTADIGVSTLHRIGNELDELQNLPPTHQNLQKFDAQIKVVKERIQIFDTAIDKLQAKKQQCIHAINDKVVFHQGEIIQLHENNLHLAIHWKASGGFIEPNGKMQFHRQEIIDLIAENKTKFVNAQGVAQDFDASNLQELPPEGELREAHNQRVESEHAQLTQVLDTHNRLTILISKRQQLHNQLQSLILKRDNLQQQLEAEQRNAASKHTISLPGPKLVTSLHKIDSKHHDRDTDKPLPKYTFTPSFAKALNELSQQLKKEAHEWKVLLDSERKAAEEKQHDIKLNLEKKDAIYYETLSKDIAANDLLADILCDTFSDKFHQDENHPDLISIERQAFYIKTENLKMAA